MTTATYGEALYGLAVYGATSPDGTPTTCWPVDTSHCEGWDALPPTAQAYGRALAGETMRSLVGYRFGGCAITLRPSPRVGLCWEPVLDSGRWRNSGTVLNGGIVLPDVTSAILGVTVDGLALDPSAYRLDNGNILVRTDGKSWPSWQDIAQPITEPGTFSVTYRPGLAVDPMGARAAGSLACEFAKAMSGQKCALPSNTTSVSRQGVTMDLGSGLFPGGQTGLRDVDLYVRLWNPFHLVVPSTVWTPQQRTRVTTSVGGGVVGIPGPRGPQGAPGQPGVGSSSAVVYEQPEPAATWTILHTFGRLPDVVIYSTDGEVIYPDVDATAAVVVVTFPAPTAGSAVLT